MILLNVLILVLLELILLLFISPLPVTLVVRFNPCFIGTYSFTMRKVINSDEQLKCFNPCFIGTYSFTDFKHSSSEPHNPF